MRYLWRLLLLLALPLGGRAEWTVENIAGTGVRGFAGDGGLAAIAVLNDPFGMARAPDGSLWFCEYGGHRLRRIGLDGEISTVAGTGERGFSGDGGPAIDARLDKPHELRFDAAGDCYFTDMANHVIRRIERRTGLISTVAGTGGKRGYAGDGGPATAALLGQPHSLQFGPDGHLYLCDTGNHVVRRVDGRTGVITTLAGTGVAGPTPDGAPLGGTPLRGPRAIDFDAQGRLWLATREGNQVFRIDLQAGRIHHVAGTGRPGFTGNGGPAGEATLSGPKGIALDREGNVWLADTESHSIRRITPDGILEVMAGTGRRGDGPEGPGSACALARPHGVFIEADGSILVGDSETHRLRRLRPPGKVR
jgi:streptogramin lyase